MIDLRRPIVQEADAAYFYVAAARHSGPIRKYPPLTH